PVTQIQGTGDLVPAASTTPVATAGVAASIEATVPAAPAAVKARIHGVERRVESGERFEVESAEVERPEIERSGSACVKAAELRRVECALGRFQVARVSAARRCKTG